MQLEQATHTALEVRKDVGQSFKWQIRDYLINHEMQSFCGWVSSYSFPWFSYCTFHNVHEFKKFRKSPKPNMSQGNSFYYKADRVAAKLDLEGRLVGWLRLWKSGDCSWMFHGSWISMWIHWFSYPSTNGFNNSGFTVVWILGSGFKSRLVDLPQYLWFNRRVWVTCKQRFMSKWLPILRDTRSNRF